MSSARPWSLRELRATRSAPPGRAANDERRRAIYGAALQQFEELLAAAAAVGPASRPLPLFYALSQAGRAIVAAAGPQPEAFGHGLTEDRSADGTELLRRRVMPSAKPSLPRAVSEAIGSSFPRNAVELGAVWSASPGLHRLPPMDQPDSWRQALLVHDTSGALDKSQLRIRLTCFGGPEQERTPEAVRELFGRYPTLPASARVGISERAEGLEPGAWMASATWRPTSVGEQLNAVAPVVGVSADRYLVRTLPGEDELVAPLILWWLLLFGLSLFARYHPQLWVSSLAVDRSSTAVPLEAVLEHAIEALPNLVLAALIAAE